jgi:peptidoglycan/xylan/chitin deacetylase (PgdA/CDA1 family)
MAFSKNIKIGIGAVAVFVIVGGGIILTQKPQDPVFVNENITPINEQVSLIQKPVDTAVVEPADISKVPILTYHSFGPAPINKEGASQLHYRVTATAFEAQMKYLSDNNYHPITFADLVENQLIGTPIPDHAVVLTFDDGWKNQYEYALPILEKYNFTATFFIITNSIDAKSYMSVNELKDLYSKGFEIASHTKSHPKLTLLDDAKLSLELEGSKKVLEEKIGIVVKTIAYPYYLHDARVMQAVDDAGYIGARGGWGKFKNDKIHLFEFVSQESVNNPNPFASKRLAD